MRIEIDSQIEDPELIERRRAQLVAAAAKCFGANGYHRTTIKEIAETAGFSPGLIYTYVKDKEDILFLVIVALLETYAREIPKSLEGVLDPLERFVVAVRAYCETVGANVDATVLAYRETKSLAKERQKALMRLELSTNRIISNCLQECISSDLMRSVNLDLATYRIVLLAHGWALKAWHFRGMTTLDEYIREGLDLFLHALLTPRGWTRWRSLETVRVASGRGQRTHKGKGRSAGKPQRHASNGSR